MDLVAYPLYQFEEQALVILNYIGMELPLIPLR